MQASCRVAALPHWHWATPAIGETTHSETIYKVERSGDHVPLTDGGCNFRP